MRLIAMKKEEKALKMSRKKTLLIALGKVESLTPPKMRLIAMKKEEKALKMPHKMKRMKKRALVMKVLQIIQMKAKGVRTKRRMDSQMITNSCRNDAGILLATNSPSPRLERLRRDPTPIADGSKMFTRTNESKRNCACAKC